MNTVMIDIETFGQGPNACIIQIGACYFDPITGEIGKTFEVNIDANSAVKAGGIIDANAVTFWLGASEEARKSILAEPRHDITVAMNWLNDFLAGASAIWSHATFDFVIVTNTLKTLGIKPKYHYRTARDIRTLTSLARLNPEEGNFTREGIHHNGLADCIFQVKYVTACLNKLVQK